MPASRENLKLCDNCKRVLLTLLVQDARQEFCSEFCTHEWCAKQVDNIVAGNVHEVIDRVKLYMAALKSNQGIMAALSALIIASHICWPLIAPIGQPVPSLSLVPQSADSAGKLQPLPPPLTLFRESDEALEAKETEEEKTKAKQEQTEASASAESQQASASHQPASPSAKEDRAS